MSLKSTWRSIKYASGPGKVQREQRLRLIEAVNNCCSELNAYVVILESAKQAKLQNFLKEDDLGDQIYCNIEVVEPLNFRCFVFGLSFSPEMGSLINRLEGYKLGKGVSPVGKLEKYTVRMADRFSEGIMIARYRASVDICTFSTFQIYEELKDLFRSIEARQRSMGHDPLDEFILHQELTRNFITEAFEEISQLLQYFSTTLRKRIDPEELDRNWSQFGSPEAVKKLADAAFRKMEQEYEDDVLRRSGVSDFL